ncbi:type I restriction endonuclease [Nonomuraea sp. NPDC049649]|uniref:type I restriction endonuclease n=1 Tax=Nonomuraea sp. NPDC049649 TaxID=3155776 RepID=UPI00341B7984
MADYEYTLVERPLIEQLKSMGWNHAAGAEKGAVLPLIAKASLRNTFDEVILEDHLRDALARINLDDQGHPWLDDTRISQAYNALTRVPATSLLEANKHVTDLLIKGVAVDGPDGGSRPRCGVKVNERRVPC